MVVDKPSGMTSHDVVGKCRRIFSTRKVGHAGTLDPMATGVLVVGIERATKILGLLTATDKSYAATIRLGQTTTTEDAEGEVLQTVSASAGRRCRHRSRDRGTSRRHLADPVGGQCREGGRQAGLRARPRRPARRVGAPGRCASVASMCATSGGVTTWSTSTSRSSVPAAPTSGRWPATSAPPSASAGTSPRFGAPASADSVSTRLARSTRWPRSRICPTSLDEACLLAFPRRDLTVDEAESARHGRRAGARGHRRRICRDGARRKGYFAPARRGQARQIGCRGASRHSTEMNLRYVGHR